LLSFEPSTPNLANSTSAKKQGNRGVKIDSTFLLFSKILIIFGGQTETWKECKMLFEGKAGNVERN
jgi:hypothetical protein